MLNLDSLSILDTYKWCMRVAWILMLLGSISYWHFFFLAIGLVRYLTCWLALACSSRLCQFQRVKMPSNLARQLQFRICKGLNYWNLFCYLKFSVFDGSHLNYKMAMPMPWTLYMDKLLILYFQKLLNGKFHRDHTGYYSHKRIFYLHISFYNLSSISSFEDIEYL